MSEYRILFQMTVDPSGIGFDLDVPLEVVIGSVPFVSVAEQYGFSAQQQSIEPPPSDAPVGLYVDPATSHTPGLTVPNLRK